MNRHQMDNPPTDMMRRRTPLPFCGFFLWSGQSVTIRADSAAILRAAEDVGLVAQKGFQRESDMRWEIVTERHGVIPLDDFECKTTVHQRSIYLDMQPGQ